ncbi:MAG: zinc metallopeptidase [Anaerolineaceae bacterium]|nr:zinc metallopeptidase [Anaerolineaceae bacterium]
MFPFFAGYGLYILISLPALLLGFWAQHKVTSAFKRYSRVKSSTGLTGSEIARRMLIAHGLNQVQVEETQGFLSDHYDPTRKILRLSPNVYRSNSLAAAGVAAHEAGHALQDQNNYAPLKIRSAIVPAVQIGSWLGPIIFMIGLVMSSAFGEQLAWIGLILFGATALFALVTLPVEFDATRRAKEWLYNSGIIYQGETAAVNSVLNAAALTYVAAAIQAISTLLYYALLLLGNRSRD